MLSSRHQQELRDRSLDVDLAIRMGIYSGKRVKVGSDANGNDQFEIQPDENGNVMCFPFFENGVEVNTKYRAYNRAGDRLLWQRKGGLKTPYNIDCVLSGDDMVALETGSSPLVWVEGEPDCLVGLMAGFEHTISLPEGSVAARDHRGNLLPPVPSNTLDIDPANDDKFSFLIRLHEVFSLVKTHIIATDNDEAGQRMAKEMVRRIGAARCMMVTWPKDEVVVDKKTGELRPCKDINEVLQHFGLEHVQDMLRLATPWPVSGLYKLSDYPDEPPPETFETGISAELDEMFRIYEGGFAVVTGIPGSGKALALHTPVPTPSGWTTMGEIEVGDFVIGDDGHPCRVVAATEVMEDRPCYALTFGNGERIVADAQHQWLTNSEPARRSLRVRSRRASGAPLLPRGSDQSARWTHPSVVTTEEIAGSILSWGKVNHQIVTASPFVGIPSILPIDAYTLGAWLGDGHSASARLTCFDSQIVEKIVVNGGVVSPNAAPGLYGLIGLQPALRALGVLNNKHIPTLYLRAPMDQRLELLRGLMDTDGSAAKRRSCEFTSVNRRLADGVFELVSSLGIKATMRFGRAQVSGKDCGEKYTIAFTTDMPVFSLDRKLDRQGVGRPNRIKDHLITSCDVIPSVPVRCIQVDNASRMFLVGKSFIPTHNSTLVNQMVVAMAKLYRWPVTLFSGEMPVKPFLQNPLKTAFLVKRRPEWTREEDAAAEAFVERYFSFIDYNLRAGEDDDDIDIDFLLQKAADAVLRWGTKILVIDPWNELDTSKRPGNVSQTEHDGLMIRKVKRFAKTYRVFVFLVAHPTKLGTGEVPGLYSISGSANFSNKAELGLIVHAPDIFKTPRIAIVPKVKFPGTGKKSEAVLDFDETLQLFIPGRRDPLAGEKA